MVDSWSRAPDQMQMYTDRNTIAQLLPECSTVLYSIVKNIHGKPRLHVSVNLFYLKYGRHLARLHRRRRRRRRRAYVPTSNTASRDNHEKITSLPDFKCLTARDCIR